MDLHGGTRIGLAYVEPAAKEMPINEAINYVADTLLYAGSHSPWHRYFCAIMIPWRKLNVRLLRKFISRATLSSSPYGGSCSDVLRGLPL
jgi:hypothetical protein